MYPNPVFAKQLPRADISKIINAALSHVFATVDDSTLFLPDALTSLTTAKTASKDVPVIVAAMKDRWNEWFPLHLLPIEVFIEILLYVDRHENIVKRNRTLTLVCKYWRNVVSYCSDFWTQVRFEDKMPFIRAVIARSPTSGITVVYNPPHDDVPDTPSGGGFHWNIQLHNQLWVLNQVESDDELEMEDGPGSVPEPEQAEDATWSEDVDHMQTDPQRRSTDSHRPSFFNATLLAKVESFKFFASLSSFRRQYIFKMSQRVTSELEIRSFYKSSDSIGDPLVKLVPRCEVEHLIIRSAHIEWNTTTFTRLRSLRLHAIKLLPSTAELRDTLLSCPSLEWIVLQQVRDQRGPSVAVGNMQEIAAPVTLPHLRSLIVMQVAPRLRSLLLHNFVAPKLRYICSEYLAPEDFHSEPFPQLLAGPLRAAASAGDVIDVAYEELEKYLSIGIKHREAGGWFALANIWEALCPGLELIVQLWDVAAWLPLEQFISNQNRHLASVSFDTALTFFAVDPTSKSPILFKNPSQLAFLRQWSSVTHLSLRSVREANILLNYLSIPYHSDDDRLLYLLPNLTELRLFYDGFSIKTSTFVEERSKIASVASITPMFCNALPPVIVGQGTSVAAEYVECKGMLGRWASFPKTISDDWRYL